MATVTHPIKRSAKSKKNTTNMTALVKQGRAALDDGNLMAALQKFEEVVAAYPDRPEGHNNLGAMYSALGEDVKAENCFDQVLTILPENSDVHYNRGVVRSRQEKFDAAREDFLIVLKATPHDSGTLNNLGVMDFMQGHLPTARTYFQQAIAADPSFTNALLNLVDVEHGDGDSAMAVALCEEFLSKNNSIEVRRKLFELLSNGCRAAIDRASRVAETLIGTDGDNSQTRSELGRLVQARSALA